MVGAKQSLAKDRVNQPVTLQSSQKAITLKCLTNLWVFIAIKTEQQNKLQIEDEEEVTILTIYGIHIIIPVVQYEQSGLYAYSTIIMTGVLTYAKNKVLGVEYTIVGSVVDLISPEIQYTAVVNSPMFAENTVAKALIESTGNIF